MILKPTLLLTASISWTLAAVCQGQTAPKPVPGPAPGFVEIDSLARDKPGGLSQFLRERLSAGPPVADAGAMVGRAFKDIGDRLTIPLLRSIMFESVYTDQAAVLEIVRQAILNSPVRFHNQIVAAAIVSVDEAEQPVIIEVAGAASSRLERLGVLADPPMQDGPLVYRVAAAGEPGAMSLGVAIMAAATSVDPNLNIAEFPISVNAYFLPKFSPPGLDASGHNNIREPLNSATLGVGELAADPRLPIPVATPSAAPPTGGSPTPAPSPVSTGPSPTPTPTPRPTPTPKQPGTPTPTPPPTPSPTATPIPPPTPVSP